MEPRIESMSLGQTFDSAGDYPQVQMALKNKGARDDITIVVLDVVPGADDRIPPMLRRHAQRGTAAAAASGGLPEAAVVDIVDPLVPEAAARSQSSLWFVPLCLPPRPPLQPAFLLARI